MTTVRSLEDIERENKIFDIARVLHEVNRTYCRLIGDDSQEEWERAPYWQVESAIAGVMNLLDNPGGTPLDSHNSWLRHKVADGWVYGDTKDPEKKTHPCIVPYDQLPEEQRYKYELFHVVGRMLIKKLEA